MIALSKGFLESARSPLQVEYFWACMSTFVANNMYCLSTSQCYKLYVTMGCNNYHDTLCGSYYYLVVQSSMPIFLLCLGSISLHTTIRSLLRIFLHKYIEIFFCLVILDDSPLRIYIGGITIDIFLVPSQFYQGLLV